MQQYYSIKKDGNTLYLDNDDLHHIKNVMRMKENDKVIVVYSSKSYICFLNKDLISCTIEKVFKENENNTSFKVYVPLLSEDKMSNIFKYGTSLGITEYIVVLYDHCKYKLNKKDYDKKLNRWNKIIKEASEQSYRIYKPIIKQIITVDNIYDNNDVKLLCSLDTNNVKDIKEVLNSNSSDDTISVAFGPEGGFKSEEEKQLEDKGFIKVSLGNNVLRTELVPLYIASVKSYLNGSDINE